MELYKVVKSTKGLEDSFSTRPTTVNNIVYCILSPQHEHCHLCLSPTSQSISRHADNVYFTKNKSI
jgi:hypothetical protein